MGGGTDTHADKQTHRYITTMTGPGRVKKRHTFQTFVSETETFFPCARHLAGNMQTLS